ncbi:MAG TPA: hypothetical protein VHE33_00120 [Acidobacteriaceae bacterium]|nr:hypothetical protein [Acidobacteriaceae bacterium]
MLRRASCLGMLLALGGFAWGQGLNSQSGAWVLERSGTTVSLRGVQSLGGGVAWASGAEGTVLRTEDGGYEWQSCAMPPDADKLDFRGLWAWDANTAVVMSSGTGEQSRVYRTTDGCSHWTLVLTDPDKEGFFDSIVFSSRQVGYLLGDPVDGAFPLFRTGDGGATWTKIQSPGLTTDGLSIAAFAASNSSLAADHRVWFVTGGQGGAFLYEGMSDCPGEGDGEAAPDCSDHWTFHRQPLPMAGGSASAGAFSVRAAWWNGRVRAAVAVGGDYAKPDVSAGTSAWTPDGKTWKASEKAPGGYRSAVNWDANLNAWIAVGPTGSDVSWDGGRHWKPLDGVETGANWNALSLPFAVGSDGKIGKINLGELHK